MNILQVLKRLRDDLKTWATNNFNALNTKIEEKTIPIDNELDLNSTNPVQNKTITQVINNIPKFSGDYNDLINAPNITEDDSGNMVITDDSGNIIFKVDSDGIHTTSLSLNGETAATKDWVENKHYLTAHQDLSHKSDVGHKHVIGDIKDLPDYATKDDVDKAIADFVEADPVALEALQELSQALENHEDAYDALLGVVGSKATREDLENLKTEISESIVSDTNELHIVDDDGNIIASIDGGGITTTVVNAQDILINNNSVEAHTKNNSIHITDDERNTWNNKSDFSGKYEDLIDAPDPVDLSPYYTKLETDRTIETAISDLATEEYVEGKIEQISESIISESEEWNIVDSYGNIVATIDKKGLNTVGIFINDIPVLDKITTTAGAGLKVTENNNIDIDDDVTFIFNGGTSTGYENIDDLRLSLN